VDNTAVLEQNGITVNLTREQHTDLLDSLDAVVRDMEELTKLEAVVNSFRDRGSLHTPLGQVLRELEQTPSSSAHAWRNQAKFKYQDLIGLMTRVRELLCRPNRCAAPSPREDAA